jgi:hypothetical protein
VAKEPHVRVEVVPAPRRWKVTVLIWDRVGISHPGLQRLDLLPGDGQELLGLVPLRIARGIGQDVAHEPRIGSVIDLAYELMPHASRCRLRRVAFEATAHLPSRARPVRPDLGVPTRHELAGNQG